MLWSGWKTIILTTCFITIVKFGKFNSYVLLFFLQHGTCPVCRKDLNGEDTSLKDSITPILDDTSNSDNANGT